MQRYPAIISLIHHITKGIYMQLYFIRHGQSVNNAGWADPNYKEHHDPELTQIGLEQAQILADHLKKNQSITDESQWNPQNRHGYGITHIYTSLMERAAHTASFIARRLPETPASVWMDIHESGGIYERNVDVKSRGLSGRPRAFFEENFPELNLPDTLDETGWWNRPHETEAECQMRAEQALAELLSRHGDKDDQLEQRVIFISHGGFFVHFLSAILNIPWRSAVYGMRSWFLLNNCSISRIDIRKDRVTVAYLNRTDHLPDHLIT